jgi:H+/Cl- antiporter ClcA
MRPKQFRLWHMMSTVGVAALILAVLVRLFPPERSFAHSEFIVSLEVAGFEIPHTSPVFWLVTGFLVLAVLGIIAGLIAIFIWATRAHTKDALEQPAQPSRPNITVNLRRR